MFVPKTSRPRGTPLREYRVGKGDYIIGGAWTMPFSGLDGPLRRRPMVFGEVRMHDTEDPVMTALMWRDLGADGLCLRILPGDSQTVSAIATATAMPIMVNGPSDAVEETSSAVEDSIMVLHPEDEGAVDPRDHLLVGEHIDLFPPTVIGPGLRVAMDEGLRLRSEALSASEPGCPTMCDTTSVWDAPHGTDECDMGRMTMLEAQAALAAILAGADIIVMRDPTALDSAIGYGEELADL